MNQCSSRPMFRVSRNARFSYINGTDFDSIDKYFCESRIIKGDTVVMEIALDAVECVFNGEHKEVYRDVRSSSNRQAPGR